MRVAVVGASRVAERHYLPALARVGPAELGVLSGDRSRAAELVDRFGGTVLPSPSLAPAGLAEFGPDIVFVLTREEHHAAALQLALAAGAPRIYCEKPLVARHGQLHIDESDWAEGVSISERATAVGTEIGIGFNYRTFVSFRRGLAVAQEREWGQLVSLTAHAHSACLSHVLDLLMVTGGPITEVFALEGSWQPSSGGFVGPDRHVVARLGSGATADLHVSAAGAWEDSLVRLTAQFEAGRFTVVDLDQGLERFDPEEGGAEYVETAATREEGYARSFQTAIGEYLAAVASGRPAPTGIDAALRHLRTEAMIVRSIGAGRSVFAAEFAGPGGGEAG